MFCSEAWGSLTSLKSQTRDPQLKFRRTCAQDFYVLKEIHRPQSGLNPRTLDTMLNIVIEHISWLSPRLLWCVNYDERIIQQSHATMRKYFPQIILTTEYKFICKVIKVARLREWSAYLLYVMIRVLWSPRDLRSGTFHIRVSNL